MLEEFPAQILHSVYKSDAPIYLRSFQKNEDKSYKAVCAFPPNPRIEDTHVGIAEMMVALSQAAYCVVANDAQAHPAAYGSDTPDEFKTSMKEQAIGKLNVHFSTMLYPEQEAELLLRIEKIKKIATVRLVRIGMQGFMKGTVDCVLSSTTTKPE